MFDVTNFFSEKRQRDGAVGNNSIPNILGVSQLIGNCFWE